MQSLKLYILIYSNHFSQHEGQQKKVIRGHFDIYEWPTFRLGIQI